MDHTGTGHDARWRLRACICHGFGFYAIRIKDAGTFVREMVGTDGRFTIEQMQENLGGKIGLRIKEAMPDLGIPVLELETKAGEMGARLRERLAPELDSLGLELLEVQVQEVGLEIETKAQGGPSAVETYELEKNEPSVMTVDVRFTEPGTNGDTKIHLTRVYDRS